MLKNFLKRNVIITISITAFILSSSPTVFSDGHKDATHKKYTMCAAVRMKEVKVTHLEKQAEKHSTLIPEGWTVVGGTGGEGHPKLLLCR